MAGTSTVNRPCAGLGNTCILAALSCAAWVPVGMAEGPNCTLKRCDTGPAASLGVRLNV